MAEPEIPLSGGNLTQVARVGNTVRRSVGTWSPAVHDLLRFLQRRGFEGAPEFLGTDEQGREILSFIEGEVGNYPMKPYMWSDETLAETARFLRRFHDLTATYQPPENAKWQMVYPDESRHEVICHNDFAPYNLVFVNQKPFALLDFDLAGPGPRLWDIAYAVYRFVPLSWAEDIQALGLAEIQKQSERLRLFCHSYGLDNYEGLLEMVAQRIEILARMLVKGVARKDANLEKLVQEGHLAHYRREIEAFQQRRSLLAESLK